jgi:hypothetical protein
VSAGRSRIISGRKAASARNPRAAGSQWPTTIVIMVWTKVENVAIVHRQGSHSGRRGVGVSGRPGLANSTGSRSRLPDYHRAASHLSLTQHSSGHSAAFAVATSIDGRARVSIRRLHGNRRSARSRMPRYCHCSVARGFAGGVRQRINDDGAASLIRLPGVYHSARSPHQSDLPSTCRSWFLWVRSSDFADEHT